MCSVALSYFVDIFKLNFCLYCYGIYRILFFDNKPSFIFLFIVNNPFELKLKFYLKSSYKVSIDTQVPTHVWDFVLRLIALKFIAISFNFFPIPIRVVYL